MRASAPCRRWLAACLAAGALCARAGDDAQELYLAAYRLERDAGDDRAALEAYRRLAADEASGADAALRARALLRAGLCARRLGLADDAAQAWTRLLADFGGIAPAATLARAELDRLAARSETATVSGRVMVGDPPTPLVGACVFAGNWAFESIVLTDEKGGFVTQCRVGRHPLLGYRYCPVYAEHPEYPLAAIEIALENGKGEFETALVLRPLVAATGRVVDAAGLPIEGARLTVSGFVGEDRVPVPAARLVHGVVTDVAGSYLLPGLDPQLRCRLGAEKPGYRLARDAEAEFRLKENPVPDIVLESAGRARLEGVITDDRGRPLPARITAYAMPPSDQELGAAMTDEGGRYVLPYLPDAPLALRVESVGGWASRRLCGIRPGRKPVSLALSREPPVAARAVAGARAPELGAKALNAPSATLAGMAGRPVLVAFWARASSPDGPPRALRALDARYAREGLRIVCIHDHSGSVADLAPMAARSEYVLAIDDYAPTEDPAAGNSFTFGVYGAAHADFALVSPAGVLTERGSLASTGDVARLEAALAALPPAAPGPLPAAAAPGIQVGAPAPALDALDWVRGPPDDLAGRTVVLHFSPAYLEASIRAEFPGERRLLDRLAGGAGGLTAIWILPSTDASEDARRLALDLMPECFIAVDREGRTYRAFGAASFPFDGVIGPDRRIRAFTSSELNLWRQLKHLLARAAAGPGPAGPAPAP